jgi:hypothetical protein
MIVIMRADGNSALRRQQKSGPAKSGPVKLVSLWFTSGGANADAHAHANGLQSSLPLSFPGPQ